MIFTKFTASLLFIPPLPAAYISISGGSETKDQVSNNLYTTLTLADMILWGSVGTEKELETVFASTYFLPWFDVHHQIHNLFLSVQIITMAESI